MFSVLVIHTDDGVFKCRLLWVVDDLLYLFVVTAYAFHKCFFIVLQLYAVKGHGVVRRFICFKKWVRFLQVLFVIFAHTCKIPNAIIILQI